MTTWSTFNERHPFGKDSTPIQGDNIAKSRERYQAMKRLTTGQGTPADQALLAETDAAIADALGGKK